MVCQPIRGVFGSSIHRQMWADYSESWMDAALCGAPSWLRADQAKNAGL